MARGHGSEENARITTQGLKVSTPKPITETMETNMQIRVPYGNESFKVIEKDEFPGLRLIIPSKLKHGWDKDEMHLRSVIVDSDDRVVSSGLPKFRNLGENPIESADFEKRLARGEKMRFLEKMDGSLAIRSVINGEVVFRTRGTFDGGDGYGEEMRKIAQANYPRLLDPEFESDKSLHFEFVHPDPDYTIVVKYDKPDLVFLSGIRHKDLSLLTWDEVNDVATAGGLTPVTMHELPTDLEGLVEAVVNWDDKEGIVARYGEGEQNFIKMKSSHYLAQHSMRFNFGPRRALELCRLEDFKDKDAYLKHLYELGLDWEVAETRLPYFEVYKEARRRTEEQLAEAQSFNDVYGYLVTGSYPDGTRVKKWDEKSGRKDFAEQVMRAYPDRSMQGTCFALSKGDATKIRASLIKNNIDNVLRARDLTAELEADAVEA